MYQFNSTVQQTAYNYFAWVPEDVSQQLPYKGIIQVMGTINQIDFKGVLLPRKPKRHVLSLNSEIRRAAEIHINDQIVACIKYDPQSRIIPVPEDLELILKENQIYWDRFMDLTDARRNEIIKYIISGKKVETRLSRIQKIVERLHLGNL